jgi:putative membrane protein
MVKALTTEDDAFLNNVLKMAESKTSAKIDIVVHSASASYKEYILVYGLILGSAVAVALWDFDVVRSFPLLLGLQLGIVTLCELLHSIGNVFILLVPKRHRHFCAARAAMQEFHRKQAHLAQDVPFVLLFVSLAERYVHVVTNPVVHQKIPGDWHKVTENFMLSIRAKGLRLSCEETITGIADALSAMFPAKMG